MNRTDKEQVGNNLRVEDGGPADTAASNAASQPLIASANDGCNQGIIALIAVEKRMRFLSGKLGGRTRSVTSRSRACMSTISEAKW